jgi:myo-inositol-1(or 4)-monophosphatase
MSTALHTELGELAARLAAEAGRMVYAGRKRGAVSASTKSTPTDVVTEFDTASERFIIGEIVATRPDDGFLGEEGADITGTSGVTWVIDPIDGTTNFLYDLAGYGVSIAAEVEGTTVAGAVYLPATGELFTAVLGAGAFCDGQPIRCSSTPTMATALIGTGFGYSPERRTANGRRVLALLPAIRDIRRMGAAAPDLCYVAAGRLDAHFEQWLNPWDIAAGVLIAREAGAIVGSYQGFPGEPAGLVAANPSLFTTLCETLDGIAGAPMAGNGRNQAQ